jgi:hypothetical protein
MKQFEPKAHRKWLQLAAIEVEEAIEKGCGYGQAAALSPESPAARLGRIPTIRCLPILRAAVRYDADVRFSILTGFGWVLETLALIAIARMLGRNLDLCFSDTYIVVSRISLVVAVIVAVVMPLAVVTIGHVQLPHR